MGHITIKDIARRLKISPSTVSRALRDHPDISRATKDRILAAAAEFNYQPNLIAKSLQTRRTNTIGVIVPEIRHNFFSSAISGIEEVAYLAGYTIMVCQSSDTYQREVINTTALVANRVDGMLVSVSQETTDVAHLQAVMGQGVPLVLFDRVFEKLGASMVVVDDRRGAYGAVAHLFRQGYRRIAHITGARHLYISRERLAGYAAALRDHGLPLEQGLIVEGGCQESDGRNGAASLLALSEPPDAIFAVNDPVAIGAYIFIKRAGLKIPGDVALVGFSNNPVSALIEPPLTTVNQPAFDMGKTAAGLLLKQIEGEDKPFVPITKVLKTELIVRQST
jgi:LacI family transcriptional regulator